MSQNANTQTILIQFYSFQISTYFLEYFPSLKTMFNHINLWVLTNIFLYSMQYYESIFSFLRVAKNNDLIKKEKIKMPQKIMKIPKLQKKNLTFPWWIWKNYRRGKYAILWTCDIMKIQVQYLGKNHVAKIDIYFIQYIGFLTAFFP